MKLTRIIAIGVIAASTGILAAEAKSLKEAEIPAEFPPASYKGKQYVDSRGCVYIRAGIDGMVNWVPRVSRDRNVLCGYQPTFASKPAPTPDTSRTAAAPMIEPAAPVAQPVAKPVAKPVVAAAPRQVAKPVAKTRSVAAAAPKAVARPVPQKVVRRAPAQAPVVAAAPARSVQPAALPAPRTPAPRTKVIAVTPEIAARGEIPKNARRPFQPTEVTTCDNVSGISRYYAGRSTKDLPVRCGPQQAPYVTSSQVARQPVTVMRGGKPVVVQRRVVTAQQPVVHSQTVPRVVTAPVGTPRTVTLDQVGPDTRIVRKHVWTQQQQARLATPVPDGYRKAWDDDRLNTRRAHETKRGIQATDLAWTRTVPRQLYVRSSGLVVTDLYPGLKYPYYSYEEMRAAGYNVSTKNEARAQAEIENRVARANASGKLKRTQKVRVSTKSVQPAAATAKVGEVRSTPKAAKATAKGRYVQIGMFGVEANANRAAARLQAMGLPARTGTLVKGGKRYRVVMAGPIAPAQIGAALAKARGAGFRDAYIR